MTTSYKDAVRENGSHKQFRQSYEPHWRELADFFLPRKMRWIADTATARGNKMNQKLIDPTPRFAVRTLAAGMHAGSTNPSMPWFKLTTPYPELNEVAGVANWLYVVTTLMRDVFERSNLYSVLPAIYGTSGTFGTACMTVLAHDSRVIQCVPHPIGSFALACNYEGQVDTKFCEYKLTAQQLAGEFGKENLSQQAQNSAGRGSIDYFDVLHFIKPNAGRNVQNYSSQHMQFESTYYELAGENKLLRSSGFEENPLCVFRWETTEITDPYGDSPGMDALGCAKAMQLQQKRKAQAIDKLVDPPMVADAGLQNQPSTLLPGGVTYSGFTANGSAPKFQPAYIIKPELSGLLEDIQDIRQLVQTAMYTDLFLAITMADPRNATAQEIIERREEKIVMLGPALQNHRQFVQSLVDRTFYIMMRQGRLPPPPEELQGVELKVEMVGLLAQALKSVQGSTVERFGGFVGQLATAQAGSGQPVTAWDKFDADQAIDEYGMAIDVPPTVIRSDEIVAQIRQQRAQAQQAQQQLAMSGPIKDVSQAAKNLSQAQVGDQNALEAVTQ